MAKKKVETGSKSQLDVFSILKKVDDSVEIIEESTFSNIDDWIPTGNYILNACLSGDLFKGVPSGRVTTICGPSGTGKSYLACSICREAQKKGYTVIYLDSEAAIDKDFVSRLGCDTSKFIIKQVNTIMETSGFIANLCKEFQEKVDEGAERPKIILVIDSLGNLTSDKEKTDTITGNQKADFTKAKEMKALFRVNAIPLSKLQIPLIAISHTYADLGSFIPKQVLAGGSGIQYAGSVALILSSAKLVDKENDANAAKHINVKKNGILVTATVDKSRFCRKTNVKFQIPYYKAPNPFVGLNDYLNWDNAGVCQGKCLDEKDYLKLKSNEQEQCLPFEFNGETKYCWPKATMVRGVGIVVKHLGKQVDLREFFSPEVFNEEFLTMINETIIKPEFELPSINSFNDVDEIKEILENEESDVNEVVNNIMEE